jgi:syntenin-1
MSLYPSLEDMKVDQIGRAQAQAFNAVAQQQQQLQSSYPSLTQPDAGGYPGASSYPDLADYMGLELSQDIIAANMPEYLNRSVVPAEGRSSVPGQCNMVAPLSGNSVGLIRAQVTHGIRELILCKDQKGKVGLRVQAINKGIFVCVVVKESPAAMAGLRFGDQILQINGTTVAGYSVDDVHKLLKKSSDNNISVVIRDRPFERTITVHKDSTNHIGFQFKDGKITAIVKDSSAAHNGVLIDHHLLEVDGQNVVGMKDSLINNIIGGAAQVVTITIMPSFIYEHMIKKLSSSLIKGKMDHSIPDI